MEYCGVSPRPTDAPNFPPPNGGGGEHPQFISAPSDRTEQNIVFHDWRALLRKTSGKRLGSRLPEVTKVKKVVIEQNRSWRIDFNSQQ